MEQDSINQMKEAIETLDSKILAAIIVAIASSIVGIATIIITYISHRQQIKEKRREERRKEIYKKLNDYYGPIAQYLGKSKELYLLFRKNKEHLKDTSEERFSTLTCMLRGHQFEGTDKELLKGILDIGSNIEDIILSKSGLIDSTELRELLNKAAAHFEIIRKTFYGDYKIGPGEDIQFKKYSFPDNLGEKIDARIAELKIELKELNT